MPPQDFCHPQPHPVPQPPITQPTAAAPPARTPPIPSAKHRPPKIPPLLHRTTPSQINQPPLIRPRARPLSHLPLSRPPPLPTLQTPKHHLHHRPLHRSPPTMPLHLLPPRRSHLRHSSNLTAGDAVTWIMGAAATADIITEVAQTSSISMALATHTPTQPRTEIRPHRTPILLPPAAALALTGNPSHCAPTTYRPRPCHSCNYNLPQPSKRTAGPQHLEGTTPLHQQASSRPT